MIKKEDLNTLIQQVSVVSGVPVEKIMSKQRNREYADARRIVWYIYNLEKGERKLLYQTFHVNHSSIIRGICAIKELIDTKDKKITSLIQQLCKDRKNEKPK